MHPRHRPFLFGALSLLLGVVAGCSSTRPGGPVVHDSAPHRPPADIASIPDAVPRVEPLSRGGNADSYVVHGRRYHVAKSSIGYVQQGTASWYGTKFHGRKTANGETYDMYAMTAAHKSLPLPTFVKVTNLRNGRSVVVRVNDRGPFHGNRLIDLSYAAAAKLDMLKQGTAPVEVRAIDPRAPQAEPARHAATPTQTPAATTAALHPQPAVSAGESARGSAIYLQVGAFLSQANAARLGAQLRTLNVSDVLISPTQDAPTPMYRVRIGPLTDSQEAERMAATLVGHGLAEPQVVVD